MFRPMLQRLIIVILLVGATTYYAVYQKSNLDSHLADAPTASILNKIPSASFQTLDGNLFDIDQYYRDNRVDLLVLHFWGTWCAPCEAELPELMALMKKFESRQGVKFLLVAVNDDLNKVKKHIKTLGVPKASIVWLLDNNNSYKDKFGTTRVPETYVFSSDKMTLRKYVGPQEWNKGLFFQKFDEFFQISTQKL